VSKLLCRLAELSAFCASLLNLFVNQTDHAIIFILIAIYFLMAEKKAKDAK
jgi:hypothetical protein